MIVVMVIAWKYFGCNINPAFIKGGGLALLVLFCTLGTTCEADAAGFSAARRSQIWREEFPVPNIAVSDASASNVGMAPSTFDLAFGSAKAAPRAGVQRRLDRPHPAVARIVVPEEGATSYGSGTLIDVREEFGLVITNWHVVRDATGTIEVLFPDGFTSQARALKVDADWDLAALIVWRPRVEPVSIAARAPRPGDPLTICGYGQGNYRALTGRCTQYYAPRQDFPRHMVELDVEARQGDSGGPIFNEQGDLAGVLFGAGQGTTLGSFGGRVGAFLATLAPDIGQAGDSLADDRSRDERSEGFGDGVDAGNAVARQAAAIPEEPAPAVASVWPSEASAPVEEFQEASSVPWPASGGPASGGPAWGLGQPVDRENFFEQMKTVLAAVGLLTIVVQMLRVAR